MNEKCVCYIDVLGFSNYVIDNVHCGYAADILSNIHHVLRTRQFDKKIIEKNGYDSRLEALVQRTSVDSFDDYLTLSDSIFITSQNPDLFIKQLSTFLWECFLLHAEHFQHPEDSKRPELVTLTVFRSGKNMPEKEEYFWYPVLVRGGITYGEVVRIENYCICGRQPETTRNLVGKGVVKAVNLEKMGKGPHLFIDDNLYEKLSDELKQFIVEKQGVKYILWPVFHHIWENEIQVVYRGVEKELEACITLWNAYKDKPYSVHYSELLKLVVRSFLKGCEIYHFKYYDKVKKQIKERLEKSGIIMYDSIDFLI